MKFKHTPKRTEKARTVLLTGQLQTRWSGTTQPNSKEAGAICSGLFFTAQFCAVRQKDVASTVYRVAIMCYNMDSRKGVS